MEKHKLLALLESQRAIAQALADSGPSREWWSGYVAAMHWLTTQVNKED